MNLTPEKFISVLDRLYTFSSNKRFRIKANEFYSSDDIGELALNVNEQISHEYGLNIFEISEPDKIARYEEILSNKVAQFSFDNFLAKGELEEEESLFRDAYEVNTDYFLNREINLSLIGKSLLKEFNISLGEIKKIIFAATKVFVVESSPSEKIIKDVFLVSEYFIRNKKRVIFLYLKFFNPKPKQKKYFVDKTTKSGIILPPSPVFGETFEYDERFVYVELALAFKFDDFSKYLDNPLKLFFKALDYYGEYIDVGNDSKMFYRNIITKKDKSIIDAPRKYFKTVNSSALFYSISIRENAYEFSNVYAFRTDLYLNDFETYQI